MKDHDDKMTVCSDYLSAIDSKAVEHFIEKLGCYQESVLAGAYYDTITIPDLNTLPKVIFVCADEFLNAAVNLCESPIEQMMLQSS